MTAICRFMQFRFYITWPSWEYRFPFALQTILWNTHITKPGFLCLHSSGVCVLQRSARRSRVHVCVILWTFLINPSGCQVVQAKVQRDDGPSSRCERKPQNSSVGRLPPVPPCKKMAGLGCPWLQLAVICSLTTQSFSTRILLFPPEPFSVLWMCSVSQICITSLHQCAFKNFLWGDSSYLVFVSDSSFGHMVTGIKSWLKALLRWHGYRRWH